MRSALRPYVTTGIAIAGASVIAAGSVLPVASASLATAPTASTQNVDLRAKVLTLSPSDSVVLENTPFCLVNDCVKVDYAPYWSLPGEFGYGVEALQDAILANEGDKIIYTHSSGGIVAGQWYEKYGEDYDEATQGTLKFVLLGNPGRANGGSNTIWGETFPDMPEFEVIDVTRQYDSAADYPTNIFSPGYSWALGNLYSSFFLTHLKYDEVDIDDPNNYKWTENGVEYVFNPTENLPMLEGLRWSGADSIADALQDPLKNLIESAYDRSDLPPGAGLGTADPTKSFNNILPNLINAVLSIPMAEINAINRFSAALEESKSWWVYTPVNVLGWDPPNEEMTKGFVDMLLPFAPFSNVAGQHTFLWLAANLPMDAGCSGLPPCPEPQSILEKMFTVGAWEFYSEMGYTFPEVINPVSDLEGYWGQELFDEFGNPISGLPTNWSEENFKLDPYEGWAAAIDYFVSTPQAVEFPTLKEIFDTTTRLITASIKSFYPFVPQSTLWNPSMSLSAYVLRPFAGLLCPDCNKIDPFMPVDWKVGDSVPAGSYVPPKLKDVYNEDGEYIGPPIEGDSPTTAMLASSESTDEDEESTEKTDVFADAVQSLLSKFDLNKDEDESATDETETPAAETPAEEEAPAAETPAEEEAPAEETPAAETPVEEEAPAEETPAAETPVEEEAPAEEAPADKGGDEAGDKGDEAGDEAPADKGDEAGDEAPADKGDEAGDKGDDASGDTAQAGDTGKRSTTGGKHRKGDASESEGTAKVSDDKSGSDTSDSSKSSAGSNAGSGSSGGSDSSGGGSDD